MLPWKDMPPLTALRAFSAFAEAGTMERAGAMIGVTHAAISQQIRALEGHLRVQLVQKSARGLALTDDGQQLAMALSKGFGTISNAVEAITASETERPLYISTTPSFAAGWLMPRLSEFRAAHPSPDLMIDASPEIRPIGPGGVDLAIRFGTGDWVGYDARLLLPSSVIVVAAPSLIGNGPLPELRDLAHLPWLQEHGTSEATGAFLKLSPQSLAPKSVTSLPGTMLMDAARDGHGIAVVSRAFVEADIAAGRLVVLGEDKTRVGYFLVTREGIQRPAVKTFISWALRHSDQRPKG